MLEVIKKLFWFIVFYPVIMGVGLLVWGGILNIMNVVFRKKKFSVHVMNENSNWWTPFWIGVLFCIG